MAHSVFTIVVNVIPGKLDALEKVLAAIQVDIDQNFQLPNPLFDFTKFQKLHFASFVIFDRETPAPFLVFENSVDDSPREYLDELMTHAGPGIDAIYQNCVDYPVGGTPQTQRQYLEKAIKKPQLYHIGTAYRRRQCIVADAALRQQLDARVDGLMNPSLRAQLERTIPVLPGRPKWSRTRKWLKWAAAGTVTLLLIAALVRLFWERHPSTTGLTALLLVVAATGYARSDWGRDRRLNALLAASAATRSPASVWRELQTAFPVERHDEPRVLERIKNWMIALLPVAVGAIIIRYLWDRYWVLSFLMATAFFLNAVWQLILVGWPKDGQWGRLSWFPPGAALIGIFFGMWPRYRSLAAAVAVLLLGGLAMFVVARVLAAGRAREGKGTWRIIPFGLLALGVSWLSVVAGRALWSAAAPWISDHLPARIGGWLTNPARWFVAGIEISVGALAFVAAFIALVFVSTMKLRRLRPSEVPPWLLALSGGLGALLFWLATEPGASIARWIGPATLAFLFIAVFLAFGNAWLRMPNPAVTPICADRLRALTKSEDRDVQNHMAAMVRIRNDGPPRAFLLKLFLHTLNRAFYRTVLPDWWKSTLFGIPTVHFAQWSVIDSEHHLFLSNYDLSWSVYLDDFGTEIATGIQKIWGQGEGNPGVTNLGIFKDFVRTQMVPHQVWYSAYPGLTALQISSNEQIRRGLLKKDVDEETSVELLRRLAGIEGP